MAADNDDIEAKALGQWIRSLRGKDGRTVGDLASETGISQRELERWEKGAHSSQAISFMRLLDALGINIDQPVETRAPLRRELLAIGDRIETSSEQVRGAIRELAEGLQLDLRLLQRSVTALAEKAEVDVRRAHPQDVPSRPEDAGERHPGSES